MTNTKLLPGLDALRVELADVEERVGRYTLADAIREGASVSKQRFNGFVTPESSCALGAAFVAATARGLV